jgi:hypothetical protein
MEGVDVVQIAELVNDRGMIEDRDFEDREIRGPAMLTPAGPITVEGCDWGAPFDQMFHVTEKEVLVGVIGLSNVAFRSCVFRNIGFMAHPDFIQAVGHDALRDPDRD